MIECLLIIIWAILYLFFCVQLYEIHQKQYNYFYKLIVANYIESLFGECNSLHVLLVCYIYVKGYHDLFIICISITFFQQYMKKLVSITIICFFVQRSIIIISICKWDCVHVFKSIVHHFLFRYYTLGKAKVHTKKKILFW